MIECPECLAQFSGLRCACGYTPPKVRFLPTRETRNESVASEHSRQWLEHRGIHKPGMTRKEKTEANRAYLRKLKTMAKPEPHAWAYEILSSIADGEIVTHHAETMAREVTGVQKDEREAA